MTKPKIFNALIGTPPVHDTRSTVRWTIAAMLLSSAMVVLELLGVMRAYSPVPFWDMWDGYIGFFLRVSHDGWPIWFEAHAEHHIVLSRLFFYADIAWLGGRGILPLTVSLLMAATITTLFCRATVRVGEMLPSTSRVAVYTVVVGVVFFWSQRENFTWAFQTQFFLAQALPLLAFYLAGSARVGTACTVRAFGAIAVALIALGTMANGILALPLLLVLGACVGFGTGWLATTALATCVAVLLFRIGFSGSQTHVSMLSVLLERPLDVLHFTLRYIGSPMWFAFDRASWAFGIAETAAALLLLAAAALLPGAWRARHIAPMRLAMLAVIAYVVTSAFGTALGRLPLPYGVAGATASRYTGMAGMAWLALLVAALPAIRPLRSGRFGGITATVLLLALMPWQLHALRSQTSVLYERDLAALALATQMDDPDAIGSIYPPENAAHALDVAAQAMQAGLPAFGYAHLAEASGLLGQHELSPSCQGGIETSRALAKTTSDRRIDGHLMAPFSVRKGHPALVLDEHGTIVGWALVRPKGTRERGDSATGDPFSGYVRDARTRNANWPVTSLRICQWTADASSAHSE